MVVSSASDVHVELSVLQGGMSSSIPVSLAPPVIEDLKRGTPYGARMDMFLVEEIDWRIGVI
jgi:hypothetical protein